MRADARHSRAHLARTARDVIAAHGISAPTTLIAHAARMSRSTLYRHYGSRDDLLSAVVCQGWTTIADVATRAAHDRQGSRGLARVLRASAIYLGSHRAFLDACGARDGRELLTDDVVIDRAQRGFATLWRQASAARQLRGGVEPCDAVTLLIGIREANSAVRHAALVHSAIAAA